MLDTRCDDQRSFFFERVTAHFKWLLKDKLLKLSITRKIGPQKSNNPKWALVLDKIRDDSK